MKPSTPYWLRVIGWSLLSIGFLFVVFYGITGDLWRAGLMTFALLLFFNASKRVVILSKMAQIMDVGLKMGNTKSYPAGEDLSEGDAVYLDENGKAKKAGKK